MAELLYTGKTYRFYKLDKPTTYSKFGYELEPYEILMISDAHTHIERLAFATYLLDGFTIDDIKNEIRGCVRVDRSQVTGDWTMMIYGGDSTKVYPDEWYINEVMQENK